MFQQARGRDRVSLSPDGLRVVANYWEDGHSKLVNTAHVRINSDANIQRILRVTIPMLWIYERNNQTLHVETRFDAANKEYLLIIRSLDGKEQIERFPDAPSFQSRLSSLERQLEAERWETHSAVAMHDGWKL